MHGALLVYQGRRFDYYIIPADLLHAVHAFYLGEDADTEHPDHYITQHSSTGARYPSLHAFYASMDICNTRGKGVKNGSGSSGE